MKSSDNMYTRRTPVSGVYTGFVFMLVGALYYVTIYYSFLVSQATIESKIIISGTVLLISFGIGSLIPSLRDSGFRYYMPVRKKRLEDIKKAEEKGKKLKYPGKWQNFIYKTFRDGSVAEECSESWRKLKRGEPSYSFLEDCKNVQETVDKHRNIAIEIAVKFPKLGIYKTYHDSEKFQCLDTGFWFYSILSAILVAVNLYLDYLKSFDFSITLPPVFGGLFYVVHKLCKQKSKDMAHRYLIDINSGWKEIIAEEKRKKEGLNVEVINSLNTNINIVENSPNTNINVVKNSPDSHTQVGNINVENSPGAQLGDHNTSSATFGNTETRI